jgi:hypothetical protein
MMPAQLGAHNVHHLLNESIQIDSHVRRIIFFQHAHYIFYDISRPSTAIENILEQRSRLRRRLEFGSLRHYRCRLGLQG